MKNVAAALLSVIAFASPIRAQTASGLEDLVGTRAAGGENALRSRGYTLSRTDAGDDRVYTFWWNGSRRQCVTVATMDGRYNSITSTPAPDCGQRAEVRGDRRDRGRGRDDGDRRDSDEERPDIGFRNPAPERDDSSYAQGRGPIQVNGNQIDLGLVCFGDGQRPSLATTHGWSWNSSRNRYDYGDRTELTAAQFDASVMLQLWAGGGRISLPKKLIPPIHSRGSGDWWELYDVQAGPDIIRAKYRLNGLNKPSVTINRHSGQISIEGLSPYGFRGVCDLIDGEDHRRF